MRFFFDIHDSGSRIDLEGIELPDIHAAQIEAIKLAGRFLSDSAAHITCGERWFMEVRTECGLACFWLDFSISSTADILTDPPLSLPRLQ